MKFHKSTILVALLALLLLTVVSAMGQQTGVTDQKKEAVSCCAMDCCKDGSCPMHKAGAAQTAATEACCCSGDSCNMPQNGEMAMNASDPSKNSADMAKHAKHDKKDHSSCCNMKHDGAMSNMKHDAMGNMTGDMKQEDCCCNMKHDAASGDMKHDGSCCKMKEKNKQKEARKQ